MDSTRNSTHETRLSTWSRAADVFGDVVILPLHERDDALARRCGDDASLRHFVEAMLEADDGLPDTRDDAIARGVNRVLGHLVGVETGRRFGAFAVVEEIGRGGMGVVYLAERRDGAVTQRVALKLVARGNLDSVGSARLARERRMLATLEHPNIARLIDAGEDPTGIPYFAMEYVKGLPITRYCDERALSLPDRLRLFRQVCSAVQYSHANLVVHCDIKAGNILVTDGGLPKLLDFGIATTLGTDVPAGGHFFLSPQSAAPEQFLGQPASVATDVYALGVLLCQLTGGRLPFDAKEPAALQDLVLNAVPRLPSEAAPGRRRELRGDIDAIVAKALSKAPQDRYASVEQLDADIARHLAVRPIGIRSNERGYRAWTFVRRNVLPVSLASVLAVLAVGFGVVTLKQNESLVYERDQARQREVQAEFERGKAQQVTEFLVGLFRASKPEEAHGRDVSARQLLERGREQLANNLVQQPLLKATMLAAISEASYALDDLQGSYAAAKDSLALLDSVPSPPRHDLAVTLGALIRVENEFGYREDALAHEERALPLANEMDLDWRVDLLEARAATASASGKPAEREAALREAMTLQEKAKGRNDMRLMHLAVKLALDLEGDKPDKILTEYLPPNLEVLDIENPRAGDVLNGLAIRSRMRKEFDLSEEYSHRAFDIFSKIYGPGSSRAAAVLSTWAVTADARGDTERALEMMKKSLGIWRAANGEVPLVARSEFNVGSILLALNRTGEALPYLENAVTITEKRFASNSRALAFYRRRLGLALYQLNRFDEAEKQWAKAETAYAINGFGPNLDEVRGELACVLTKRDHRPEAVANLASAAGQYEKRDKPNAQHLKFLRKCLSEAK